MYSTLKECKEYFKFVGLIPHTGKVFNFYKRTLEAERYNYNTSGNIYGIDWLEYLNIFTPKQPALSSGVIVKELKG